MSESTSVVNRVKERRIARGWSQDELARRSGISRAGVSAIEIGRLVPSTAAALALAAAFECRVEELFQLSGATQHSPTWAWPPLHDPSRYWHAEVAGRELLFPAEATGCGMVGHDGVFSGGTLKEQPQTAACQTLVLACCDPAAGLLATELARTSPFRLLVFPRSSRQALSLLSQGLVHAAGVHLASSESRGGNAAMIRDAGQSEFSLLRMAEWEEGLAFASDRKIRSVKGALKSRLRWVGREAGSGARQCLDELLDNRPAPRRIALDHRGVADAIRFGWADIGVCLKLIGEEAGLEFLSVRHEAYDLCFPNSLVNDPRILALINVVRSPTYRTLLSELPGYTANATGELERVE